MRVGNFIFPNKTTDLKKVYTFSMQEIESQTDLRRVESRVFLRQSSLPLHVEHEITTTNELNDKEEPGRCLETRVQSHEEGVIRGGFKDVLFRLNPVDVLVIGDQSFLDHFHRVDPLRLPELDHEDLGVRASSDNAYQLEVRQAVLAITGTLCSSHLVQSQFLALDVARRP